MGKEKENLEQLDRLAQKFIIGHAPLTTEQKDILFKIRQVETQCNVLECRKKRLERILTVLYSRL